MQNLSSLFWMLRLCRRSQELCSVMKRFSLHSVDTMKWLSELMISFVWLLFRPISQGFLNIYSQNLCLNLGSCWYLKRCCDVELCRAIYSLLCTIWSFTLFLLCLWETCQIQSNKIHFYFYYPFILLFILQWNNSFSRVF